jgi:probable phosphoglycerate mutase
LTDRGRAQAARLRDRLCRTGEIVPDTLLCSTLPRARETAAVVRQAFPHLALAEDCDLCELHPGECDGLEWDVWEAGHSFDMAAEPDRPLSAGGESLRTFQARVDRALAAVLAAAEGRTVLAVTHGGFIVAASLTLLGLPGMHEQRPFRLNPANTSLTEWSRPAPGAPWVLERYNDAAHLAGGG